LFLFNFNFLRFPFLFSFPSLLITIQAIAIFFALLSSRSSSN
jgi:hypothetical protein